MDNTREKLIELMKQIDGICPKEGACSQCELYSLEDCYFISKADHLISNGVTIQEECHWATEQAYKNGYEKGKQDAWKWIPVTERLPKKDGDYLVVKQLLGGRIVRIVRISGFAKNGKKISEYDFQYRWKNVWYDYDSEYGYFISDSVTHWMPLPEAPKGE